MNIGDCFQWKTQIGAPGDNITWCIVKIEDNNCFLETKDIKLLTSLKVPLSDMLDVFIKVGKDGRLQETEEDQLDWFSGMLPMGEGNPFGEVDCFHDWKEYVGFTESYIYCTKCDKKQEFK